jgi:transposase
LLAGDGYSISAIAKRLHVSAATVRRWCTRFQQRGVGALEYEATGRGRPRGMSALTTASVLKAMADGRADRPWTARRLAIAAHTSASSVVRVWGRYNLDGATPPVYAEALLRNVNF